MPLYEYYCQRCNAKFELLRPMSRGDDPAPCPKGHPGAARVMSVFAAVTKDAAGAPSAVAGGGCACGGAGCGCSRGAWAAGHASW